LRRFAIWVKNHQYIERHNNQNPPRSFELGHNHFSDLTNDEYQQLHFLGQYNPGIPKRPPSSNDYDEEEQQRRQDERRTIADLPDRIDWVELGAVTPVENQARCGACWSFSATGAIESAKFIKDGELVELSKQMMVDCDGTEMGCDGGLITSAFQFTYGTGGLCTEEEYPYVAKQGDCRDDSCQKVPDSEVMEYVDVRAGSETNLMHSLAMQPVSVGIQASQTDFQLYRKGVYDSIECGDELDHGVLAVGYGTDEMTGKTYWKVKNSWGHRWGEGGYIRIGRESSQKNGICGILSIPSRPIV